MAKISSGVTLLLITASEVASAQPTSGPQWVSPPASAPAPGPGPAPTPGPGPAPAPGPVPAPAPSAAAPAPSAAAPTPAYPYPAYPTPYPPPPGYEYYYPYPPPPKPRFSDNAAVSSTPFIDALIVGQNWENRFSELLNVGAQAGAYVAGRLRLSARMAFPTERVKDDRYSYSGASSKSYSFLYGASAGVVAIDSQSFVMSPGLAFARSDVSDYGSMLAFSMPFDWVLASGIHLGLEVDFGRAFGGRSHDCDFSVPCSTSNLTPDRPSGTAFWLQFAMGFGFNHPAPLSPERAASDNR